jgi:hypothetical protein
LYGSAKVTGGPLGLQIRCRALKPSWVGSIPMHFRHFISKYNCLRNKTVEPKWNQNIKNNRAQEANSFLLLL